MEKLNEAREVINQVDKEIAELFEKRMHVVKDVIAYKLANNMDIFQSAREKDVIEKNVNRIKDESLKPYAQDFLVYMMEISKSYQQTFLDKTREIDK